MLTGKGERGMMFTPAWGCGLKFAVDVQPCIGLEVHPRLGVWIEIKMSCGNSFVLSVHPRLGVWIEIT